MKETFTATQREIVARKMGYEGPMQGFDEFLMSTPSQAQRYSDITTKFSQKMARGGVVRRYAAGGYTGSAEPNKDIQQMIVGLKPTDMSYDINGDGEVNLTDAIGYSKAMAGNTNLGFTPSKDSNFSAYTTYAADQKKIADAVKGGTTTADTNIVNPTQAGDTLAGGPEMPKYTAVAAKETAVTSGMAGAADKAAGTATTGTASKVETADITGVTAPNKVVATTIAPDAAQTKVETQLKNLTAEQGTVSDKAQVTAAQQEPTTTAVAGVKAAQAEAAKVVAPAQRTLQEGELVSGSTVDMARVEDTLAKAQAAEGTVTEEMTAQGQLNKLLTDFDAKTPPPWASASIRAVTAQLAARGLGASSLAGQAVIQATLEAGVPIAQADAKVFAEMGLKNLSNRQQTAILVAQQRADFLKQDFDDAFKAKVLNAAKISDIANKNFDAETTIALENARLANSINIANLSADNAVVLAKMTQMASLETTNLNNRQLAAVQNAKAFLEMDVKNLELKQQTNIFKTQRITDSIVSDTAAANAAKAVNATNALEADKINATLALTADQYNAAERNKIKVANMNAANELIKFNAEEQNNREEFNSRLVSEINIANAKILADVSTANTREVNAANAVNAKNATELSGVAYTQLSQTYRDKLEMSWKTGEAELTRLMELARATITANASGNAATIQANANANTSIGTLLVKGLDLWAQSGFKGL